MRSNDIVEIYSAESPLEAHALRALLEQEGIQAEVSGEMLSLAAGSLPLGQDVAPRIWVRQEYAQRAAKIIAAWVAQRESQTVIHDSDNSHKEATDGESSENHTPDVPTGEHSTEENLRPRFEVAMETCVVLALFVIPNLGWTVIGNIWPNEYASRPLIVSALYNMLQTLPVTAVVLYLIYRSAESPGLFGLMRPNWIADPLVGAGLFAVNYLAVYSIWMAKVLPSTWSTTEGQVTNQMFADPGGTPGYSLWILSGLANALCEELVMRAYLIPRFERLLGSSFSSVVLSAFLFGAYHAYLGPAGAIHAGLMGFLFGAAFCAFRRLWPLVFGHWLADIVVTLS